MKQYLKNTNDAAISRWKKITGWSIVVMAVLAMVAMGLFFAEAFEQGPEEYQSLIDSNSTNYLIASVAWVLILVTDIVASIGVYMVFKHNRTILSMISSSLRLVYSGFLLWGVAHLFYMSASGLEMFKCSWSAGLVIFGFHLILLAFLYPAKGLLMKFIMWMLIIGGIGYIIVHGIFPLVDGFPEEKKSIETAFMAPMMLGEVGLALILVIKPSLVPVLFHDPSSDAA